MDNSKTCTKCRQVKSLADFYRSSRSKSGYDSRCKVCSKEATLLSRSKNSQHYLQYQRQWRNQNREHLNRQARGYYWKKPELYRARSKDWSDANKDKVAERNAVYRLLNRDYLVALMKEWRKANPDKAMYYNNLRRTRMNDNGIYEVTAKDLSRLMAQPCFYCGNKAEHVDHVVPIARGGCHSIGNLLPACRQCNQSKGAKFITEWRKR